MPLKDPDAIAAIVSALRRIHGDDAARAMLADGVTLAALIDAMFSQPIANRDAVRLITRALGDFAVTPDIGPLWHLRYVYEDRRASLDVVDMEIATPDRTFASTEISLRLPV